MAKKKNQIENFGQLSLFGDSPSGQRSLFDVADTESDCVQKENVVDPFNKVAEENIVKQNSADEQVLQALMTMTVDHLSSEIHKHNILYSSGKPIIQDSTYDRLVERLRQIEPENSVLNEMTSPEVSESSNGKVEHDVPMLSIHKPDIRRVFKDIQLWLDTFKGDVIATPKIDGLACSIQYDRNGDLRVASTRGNGRIGENITANARFIEGIPLHIDMPGLEVRGEVYMPLDAFRAFEGEKISARNLAVGGLKQKIATETARYHLSFFAYEAIGREFNNDVEKFEILMKLGFITPWNHIFERTDKTNSSALIEEIKMFCNEKTVERGCWNYDADGIVFKVSDNQVQKRLGSTDHHPRCAIAYKFPCMEQESTLRNVVWQVAKGSTITPVAIFDTVELAGAMVQKATLSNVEMVEKFNFGSFDGPQKPLRYGTRILVSRRGDVIPHVEYAISESECGELISIPDKCPSCGASVIREGKFLKCSDPDNCPATGQALIENYTKVTGCLGFGEKIIENLFDSGLVETPADLYRLTIDSIGLAVSSDENGNVDADALLPKKLYDSIQNTKKMKLSTFLEALSIPSLGHVNCQKLAEFYHSIEEVIEGHIDDYIRCITGKSIDVEEIEKQAHLIYDKIQSKSLSEQEFILKTDRKLIRDRFGILVKDGADCLGDSFSTMGELAKASFEEIFKSIIEGRRNYRSVKAIMAGLNQRKGLIRALLQYVEIESGKNVQISSEDNFFAGKSFLFTGTLESMKREDAQKRVEALGGISASGVTKTLSVLVATSTTSSKWQKAQALNDKGAKILLWTEEDFLKALSDVGK